MLLSIEYCKQRLPLSGSIFNALSIGDEGGRQRADMDYWAATIWLHLLGLLYANIYGASHMTFAPCFRTNHPHLSISPFVYPDVIETVEYTAR